MNGTELPAVRLRISPGVALAWPIGLWLLIMTTFAKFRHREAEALWTREGFDVQTQFQIAVWLGLGLLALRLVLKGRIDLRLFRGGPLFWYSCYCAWAMVSTLWSPAPVLSAFRATQIAVVIVLVASLGPGLGHVYKFILAFLLVNWLLVILGVTGLSFGQEWICTPGYAYLKMFGEEPERPWRFCSAFGHPSIIGVVAAAGALGLVARTRGSQWRTAGPLAAFFALTCVLALSRTSIAALAAGLVLVLVVRRELWPAGCLAAILTLMMFMTPDFQRAALHVLRRGQSDAEFNSLTGRDEVYAEALLMAKKGGFFGNGFQAARAVIPGRRGGDATLHAHNAMLESLVSLGVPGVALAVITILSLLGSILRIWWTGAAKGAGQCLTGWELAAFALPLLAFGVTDSAFAVAVNPYTLLFLVVLALTQSAADAANEPVTLVRAQVKTMDPSGLRYALPSRGL